MARLLSLARIIACSSVAVAASLVGSSAMAALVYADSAVRVDTTNFGSGVLTGAPDNGGAWLSNTSDPPTLLGSITAGFAGGLADGAGVDLVIYDCCSIGGAPSASESADVFVSTDGVSFTLLGAYGAGVNSFDFNGIYAGVVNYVRIVNTSRTDSPDIDAFQGNYAAATAVPEPAGLGLVALALAGVAGWSRRRT